MSNEIKTAIRAVVAVMREELATGTNNPELRELTAKAIKAAERVVGPDAAKSRTRHGQAV